MPCPEMKSFQFQCSFRLVPPFPTSFDKRISRFGPGNAEEVMALCPAPTARARRSLGRASRAIETCVESAAGRSRDRAAVEHTPSLELNRSARTPARRSLHCRPLQSSEPGALRPSAAIADAVVCPWSSTRAVAPITAFRSNDCHAREDRNSSRQGCDGILRSSPPSPRCG